jgi:hypothetical protein
VATRQRPAGAGVQRLHGQHTGPFRPKHPGPTCHTCECASSRPGRWAFGPSINRLRPSSCLLPQKAKVEEGKNREGGEEADLGKPKPGVGFARVLGVGSRRRAADGVGGGGGTTAGGCRRGDGGAGALLVHHCGGLRREDRAVRPRPPGPSSLLFCSRHRCFLSALASSGSSARERRGSLGWGEVLCLWGNFFWILR